MDDINNTRNAVQIICKAKPITDYLAKKGHQPAKRMSGGKISYCCPLPDHKEKKPSFVVYTQGPYQKFWCFGCQGHLNIIDLFAALEGISWKEALKRLSDGLDLSAQQNVQYDIEEFGRTLENNQYFADVDLLEAFSTISSYCTSYLAGVNNDPEEVLKVDQLYERLDKDLIDCEFDGINDTVRFLPEILCMRQEKFYKEENERRKLLLGK